MTKADKLKEVRSQKAKNTIIRDNYNYTSVN